jgi:UPF0755 protein
MENNKELRKALPIKVTTILNIFFGLCFLLILGYYLFSAPINRSNYSDLIIHLSSSDTLNSVSKELKNKNVIKSLFFLKSFVFLFNFERKIDKGDYLFKKTSPVFVIAWQLAKGNHKIERVKITLREGLTNKEMSDIFVEKLSGFRRDLFFEESYDKEGYLFPDTYFFFPMDTAEEVVGQLSNNFINQTKKVDSLIKESKYSKEEIITMASIIEKEAKGGKDAYLISGILWKRLEMGMPLQVDASPITYKEIGLPPTPICNSGLLSIEASLKPINSSYLYYLHDKNGEVHFAKSYEEHKSNINKFLR